MHMTEGGAVSSSWAILDADRSEILEVDLLRATARAADQLYELDNPDGLALAREGLRREG